MGIQDFATIFNNLDTACKGFVTDDQLLQLHQQIHLVPIAIEHVQAAIGQVCRVPGQVHRSEFLEVLEEIERRRSTEEMAYWDFQALDYNNTNRISLKDALLLFKEFHGDRFSMYTWHQFLESRINPAADVCFDEIRLWLCDYPQGEPAAAEQIIQEEERIDGKQKKYKQDEINSYKTREDSQMEMQEYHDNTQRNAWRKLNKWKKQGIESMLFDDGFEPDDAEAPSIPTNQLTLNKVLEMLDTKYDLLREKLLMEMARMVSTLEGDQAEMYEQLCKQERQLRRQGNFEMEVSTLPGADLPLRGSLLSLMGEIRNVDEQRKLEATQKMRTMKSQGYPMIDIGQQIQEEYKAIIDGDASCGAALCKLYKRCKEEKEFLLSHVKSESGSTEVLVVENSRLVRQHLLLGDEADFPSAAISVGLAERTHEYKSDRLVDWDRIRTEKLELKHLEERKGRKQRRTPEDETDMDTLEEFGIVNAQGEYVSEIVKKHVYEREALIQMLQGRESAVKKADAKSMRQEERNKQLKILRNQHRNWKSSSSPDPEVVLRILLEAVGLYYENRKIELQESSPKISEEETNASVLADLHQRQDVEFNLRIQELHSKSKEEVMHLIMKENKTRRLEHFDNIAYVILGTLEITEDEKEYIQALEEKYDALRERVIVMGLRDEKGVDWKRLPDKEKKKEVKERKKREVKLRGEGNYSELDDLIGPRGKAKMLPSLRKLMGEERGEFRKRFAHQRETGTIYDEAVQGSFDPVNILADLTSRLDSEQEALLGWLKQSDTKSLPIKVKRLKILRLRLETYGCRAEEDFEVAARFVGLLERAETALHGRHMSDNVRQQELAVRRSNLRRKRLLDNDMYERKTDKLPDPNPGDLIGWQAAYLRQVILRHDEEREQLLQYLQDETMDDLTEAATMMSAEEKKLRLAELHAKRRKLDLHVSSDQEENICILEEAVAIRFVCRRQEIEQETRRSLGKDDVIIALLRELQDEQDKEIASILEGIVNLDESELENLRSKEKDSRDSQELTNVFVILTQSEGKMHEKQLIKALTKKYEALQQTLIKEALEHKHGRKEWDKKSARDKEQMIMTVKQQTEELRMAGNNVGLIEVQGGLKWERTVAGLMGIGRHEFLQLSSASEGEDLLAEDDKIPADKMYNALGDLWIRFEEEKKHLLHKLKGLQEEYMSDIDQQIHAVRLWREELLCYRDNKFSVTSLLVGVAERQRIDGRPRLSGDKDRYENMAKSRLDSDVKSVSTYTFKDQVARGPNTAEQMNSAVELLENKHQSEQEFFTRLLLSIPEKTLVEELFPLSQQQRKDKLQALCDQRQEIPIERSKEHQVLFEKGLTVKREIYRHRMSQETKAEASDSQVHQLLMGELLFAQNMEAEKLLSEFSNMNEEDLCTLQAKLISDRKLNVAENVAVIIFSPGLILDGSTEADLLEALDGKYDALRDKLLADALMKQYGESEWQRMSELERQRKLAELKLKQRQLRREGKMDELAHILGDAFENQETLKRLMGDTKEEQERKLKERLQRRKQRLAKGMSEEECKKLEEEEMAQEEEEEKKKRRNILLDLEHRYEEEKAELLRQMEEGDDRLSREKSRQLKLMKLRRDERKARKEDKFDSAALVLGLAEENEKHRRDMTEEERKRQQRLAKQRLEAARRRRAEGKEDVKKDIITMDMTEVVNPVELREALGTAIDRRHRNERELMMKILDDSEEIRESVKTMSQEDRDNKLEELAELHRLWRQSESKDPVHHSEILTEAAAHVIETILIQQQEGGESTSCEEVKVNLLSDLQILQDNETRLLFNNLDSKDVPTLQSLIKHQIMKDEEGSCENVGHVIFDKVDKGDKAGEEEGENSQLIDALEQKYETLKDKLLEAVLKEGMGEAEWEKLSEKEKQEQLVELKMKEKKLRQEGRNDEAAALFEKLLENDQVIDQILGDEGIDEGQNAEERERRKEELREEREAQGLPVDEDTLDDLVDQEEKEKKRKRRRNVLENLDMMLEEEKAALLRMLKNQHSHIDQERQRQLAIAKLRHDQRRMKREEKLDSAALIITLGKEAEEFHKQKILNDKERNRALAMERLAARKRKLQEKAQNMEDRLKANDESDKLEDAALSTQDGLTALHSAILDTVDKRQAEERDALMDLINMAKGNNSVIKAAKKMDQQELKTKITKLEQDHKNWRKKSQQMALSVNEDKMSKKEKDKFYKGVAERRKEQDKLLSETMVYRMELEQQMGNKVDDDIAVTLLSNLQEKQESENRAIGTLLSSQEEAALTQIKTLQRVGKREGWFDNLTAMVFSMSSADDGAADDDHELQIMEKMKQDSDRQMEQEKENLLSEAVGAKERNHSEEEVKAALRQLEREQENKRMRMEDDMSAQRKKILERVAARKKQNVDKETEQITALQLVMVAESQQKQHQEAVEREKSHQGSELQKRLEARRLARKRSIEDSKTQENAENQDKASSSSSSRTVDSNPFAAMKREKTVVNVVLTDKERDDELKKLHREQSNLRSRIQDQQKQQEEMLQRRLKQRQNKKELEAQQLLSLGERQKTQLFNVKQDEKSRQIEAIQERVRGRSRSPNKASRDSDRSIPEEEKKRKK